MTALFRIEKIKAGTIRIDGVDISSIPLLALRSRIGIIPQDPIVFSSSVRFNLDPFDQFTDEQLWGVLERANMKEAISSLPLKLSEIVAEGGENFSVGQRQVSEIL